MTMRRGLGPRRKLGAVAAALFLAAGLAVPFDADPVAAEVVSSGVSVASDGTGHGTASGCQLTDGGASPSLVDAAPDDGVVCTNDSVTFAWSFNMDEGGVDGATFTQTLPAGWSWDPLSITACAGNGVDYSGTGTISVDGLTLTCVIDQPASNNTASVQIPVVAHVGATVENLSTYAAELSVVEGSNPAQVSTADSVTVRAAPRFEIKKFPTGGQGSYGNIDFGNGPEPAYFVDFFLSIYVPQASNLKGIEPLESPLTFVDDVSQISPNAVYGTATGSTSGALTHSQAGGPGTPITLTLTGANTTGSIGGSYPSTVWGGSIRIALPVAEVPAAPVGKDVVNRVDGFLPVGIHGTPNFGGVPEQGSEPGANCDYIGDPNLPNVPNDNCAAFHLTGLGGGTTLGAIGRKVLYLRAPGGVECAAGTQDVAVSGCPQLPGDTGSENGYAVPGTKIWARAYLRLPLTASVPVPLTNLSVCDKWNPQLQQIDPSVAQKVGYPNDLPASDYVVEYTNHPYANDAERQNAGCGVPGDPTTDGPWFSSIAAAGGPTAVTGVRVSYTGAATFAQTYFMTSTPMIAGDIAGPVPDFFTTRWDENASTGNPTGAMYTARSGFRLTPQVIALDKDTVPAGITSTSTGSTVEFSLAPTVSVPGNPAPDPTTSLQVIDTLSTCMLAPTLAPSSTDWTMAISVPANPGPDGIPCTGDGETGATLKFVHIGPVVPNAAVQPIRYTVVISTLVPNGASIENEATVYASGNTQSAVQRTDDWTLAVASPGAVRVSKVADVPVVEVEPDDLAWTIAISNTVLSPASAGRTEFIDVLPYDGDQRGSSFSGSLGLESLTVLGTSTDVSIEYTDQAASTIVTDPNLNASTWCTDSQFGTAGCPADIGATTAFKIIDQDFVKGEVYGVHVVASPVGNSDGDLYANNVSLGRTQHLGQAVPPTPISTVAVVGSTIGDQVWLDADADGTFDASEVGLDGVGVDLFDDAGALVDSTVTAGGGTYEFADLHSGNYRVAIDPATLPLGASPTYDLDGGATTPDNDSGVFAVGIDAERLDVDFGVGAPEGTGSIELAKVIVDPAPADALGDAASFPVTITCGGLGAVQTVTDVDLDRDGTPVTIDGLLVGSTCGMEETDTDGGTPSFSSSTVVISTDEVVEVTLTNTFPDAPPATTPTSVPPREVGSGYLGRGTDRWYGGRYDYLPRTGAGIGGLVVLGTSCIGLGVVAVRGRRRRTEA